MTLDEFIELCKQAEAFEESHALEGDDVVCKQCPAAEKCDGLDLLCNWLHVAREAGVEGL